VHPTLKFLEEGGKAQGQKDGREGRALSHPNTRRELQGQIIVPGVMSKLINQIRPEAHHHFWHEPLLIQDRKKDIVIDGREKLSKVKGNHTSFEFSMPSHMDNMSEEATHRIATAAAQLIQPKLSGVFPSKPSHLKCGFHTGWMVEIT
jgi:hypothetical protein